MERTVLTPGPDHPITVEPTGDRVVVRAGGQVIAETTRALTLQESDYPPVQYIPLQDIADGVLHRTDSQTYCPYKGDASYYTLTAGGSEITDAVWTYETPYEAVGAIAGHVAFYPQHVEVGLGDDA
ncbi:Uncharacterized conserved protein, DUF427 family [Streptomyces sp. DvalAA-14]|uniref:DUF427 domain-containing protein n=1 Tax=unclassified Streptomyces TaxID=2593676 RepID=UPI00081B61DC|nr:MULTISPECIES: DUF427 domain-containing protein [unclassified Streptomyces]MYS20990.1 DUF427 domain-containing protein [Streptomyces sp. SID4948]SCD81539.1 Uncharacterized conserved protein, DUF427 family [Streptomyces sp. DvalAA-14]